MKFKVILFDLDGTLVRIPKNFLKLINNLVLQACMEIGIQISINKIGELWSSGNKYSEVLIKWGINKQDISKFWNIFDHKDFKLRKELIKKGEMRLYEDTIPILRLIKSKYNIKTGVISNTPHEKAWYEITQFHLEQFLDCKVFLGSINQKYAKPEPDGILWCLNDLNEFIKQEKKILFVGDSEIDIIAGKKAKISTAYIVRDHNLSHLKTQPDYYLKSLYELADLLN
ncbi:MAG: HAD family hydrolase [Candidatus Helarchaeota archaeon]